MVRMGGGRGGGGGGGGQSISVVSEDDLLLGETVHALQYHQYILFSLAPPTHLGGPSHICTPLALQA